MFIPDKMLEKVVLKTHMSWEIWISSFHIRVTGVKVDFTTIYTINLTNTESDDKIVFTNSNSVKLYNVSSID